MVWDYVVTTAYQPHFSYSRNAQNVYDYLHPLGFTNEAIIGIIANMEHESCINCGQMEHGYGGDPSRGYGLVQWTPASTKIIAYADSIGANWYDGDVQMNYLMINAPQSWIKTSNFNYTWEQFKQLNDIYVATRCFFANFERGTFHNDLLDYAEYWSQHINYDGGTTPPVVPPYQPPPYTPNPDIPIDDAFVQFFMLSKKRRRY